MYRYVEALCLWSYDTNWCLVTAKLRLRDP
jgi:hypothetical protein